MLVVRDHEFSFKSKNDLETPIGEIPGICYEVSIRGRNELKFSLNPVPIGTQKFFPGWYPVPIGTHNFYLADTRNPTVPKKFFLACTIASLLVPSQAKRSIEK